ncbi:MAG: DnaJ C-terminal domain-containing protein [Planctomycetota bacterium]
MAKRDYYAVLGIERSANEDDIKRAFRDLARKYHPDVNDAEGAQERFVEIQEAYAVLSDPEKRQAYDRFGHSGVNAPAGGYKVDFDAEDLGSMFDAFFGGRGRSPFGGGGAGSGGPSAAHRANRRARPAETRHEITIDLLVSATGGKRTLEIQRGSTTQSIDVTIPPGVEPGAKLRVRGVGHADPLSPGKRGDVILTVHIRPHPLFRRGDAGRGEKSRDVYLELPVTFAEAVNGAKIDVPTPTGTATIAVPAGASSGSKLRLRGQGCQTTPAGDLYAVLMVKTPPAEALTDADREVIDRLGANTIVREGGHWPASTPTDAN